MASAVSSTTTSGPLPPPNVSKPSGAASKVKQKEKPLASLLAGATAGAIEGFVTYPTEYAKTQLQFGVKNAAGSNGAAVKVGQGAPSRNDAG